MTTIAKSFTELGVSTILLVQDKDTFTYDVSGTFVGTALLERSYNGGLSWEVLITATGAASGTIRNDSPDQSPARYRFRCSAYTSGTIVTSLADVNNVLQTFRNKSGQDVVRISEDGLEVLGKLDGKKATDVASATTIDLDAVDGSLVDVSGTTTITGITLSEGRTRIVRFTGALTLTHGSSLVLPGAANIVTAAGDFAILAGYASGVVRCVGYFRGDGTTLGLNLVVGSTTLSETEVALIDQANNATLVGAIASQPASGTIAVSIEKVGKTFTLTFTLTAAQIPVTDAAGSGSYGSLKLFDFVQAGISFLGCRQNYTAYAEGAALTGAAGDAAFEIGVGTVAIAAARDGDLNNTTQENIGAAVAQTLSGGTTTGTAHTGPLTAQDGTSTALDVYLNWAGSAASIDANSTIDVTGTIQIVGVLLGDD